MSAGLAVEGLVVRYDGVVAVDGVSVSVAPGEIVAVLGPSGCGKSSLLRAVAGLEPVADGRVTWKGENLTAAAPHVRGFGLMFQDHVLFPHLDVADNVAFGLRMAGQDVATRAARVDDMLALVGLDGYGHRRVDTLSGGEAQRVALARALAPAPRLLMLDEPLGSLDRALRDRLALDLRRVARTLGVAALHVTHDHDEAYAVADRLVVLRAGRVVRAGTPEQVWRDPGTAFVARFLGQQNIVGSSVVRPDALRPVEGPGDLVAEVLDCRFAGTHHVVTLRRDDGTTLVAHTTSPPEIGAVGGWAIDPNGVAAVEPD